MSMLFIITSAYLTVACVVLARELRVAGREKVVERESVGDIDAGKLVDFLARKNFEHLRRPDIYSRGMYRTSAVLAVEQYLMSPEVRRQPRSSVPQACLWAAFWPIWLTVGIFALFYRSGVKQGEALAEAERKAAAAAAEVERIKKQEGWA